MDLNCIIFPSPKNSNLVHLKHLIFLIPLDESRSSISYDEYMEQQTYRFLTPIHPFVKATSLQTKQSLSTQPKTTPTPQIVEDLNKSFSFALGSQSLSVKARTPISDTALLDSAEHCMPVHGYIPCVLVPGQIKKIIIFFHGNAEDLETSFSFMQYVNQKTGYSVMAVEYEGYSIYAGKPSAQSIEKDSLIVIRYLLRKGYNIKDIALFGRSIGSGPAVYAAANYNVAALILISPFLSICKLVSEKYGSICSMLLSQRFVNETHIQKVKSPSFIVHGLEDTIVPYSHAIELQRKAKGYCKVKLAQGMNHSEFSFMQDFIKPLRSFFASIHF